MIRHVTTLSTLDDFRFNVINTGIEYIEGEQLTQGKYIWNDELKCVIVDANRGYFRIPLGGILIGDTVNVRAEIFSVTGVKPHVSLDASNLNGDSSEVFSSSIESIEKSGEWECVDFSFIAAKNAKYSSIVIGLSSGEIGEFKLRNVEVTFNTKKTRNIIGSDYIIQKLDNGIMTIDYKTTIENVNINEPWGSIYGCGKAFVLPDFPEIFRGSSPLVQVSAYTSTGETMMFSLRSHPTVIKPCEIEFIRATAITNLTIDVHIHAVGKYK